MGVRGGGGGGRCACGASGRLGLESGPGGHVIDSVSSSYPSSFSSSENESTWRKSEVRRLPFGAVAAGLSSMAFACGSGVPETSSKPAVMPVSALQSETCALNM
jgi:hypothetical protein